MIISSRTPEGDPHHCPVCQTAFRLEPSPGTRDAPCPACGVLVWFGKSVEFPSAPSSSKGDESTRWSPQAQTRPYRLGVFVGKQLRRLRRIFTKKPTVEIRSVPAICRP